MQTQTDLLAFFEGVLASRAETKALEWLNSQTEKINAEASPTKFFLAFSQASRFFKKDNLNLADGEKNTATNLISNFDPSHWDVLQTARTSLLLKFAPGKEAWLKAINQLFETGDMYEQQALYAALPVMPYSEDLLTRAIDGCRTNMTVIFDAISLNNPYPAAHFPESNWNQLVLKSIFMQRPMYRIHQLDQRRNAALAEIAIDFAHERWAAGRPVMPELWRLVVPFLDDHSLDDLKKVFYSEDQLETEAGILAAYESTFPPAKLLLQSCAETITAIEYGEITWEHIGRVFQEKRA